MSAVLAPVYVYPQLMPWEAMLEDLHAAAWTDYRIAKTLGCDHSTVQAWAQGSEPRHSFGQALIELHWRVCGEECGKKRHSEAKPRE